jgi:hypothetical protein
VRTSANVRRTIAFSRPGTARDSSLSRPSGKNDVCAHVGYGAKGVTRDGSVTCVTPGYAS